MNLNIRVSGPAWMWINSSAEILWGIFAFLWYDVLSDLEYESRIKWWVNWYDINISDKNAIISKYVDVFLAFSVDSVVKSKDYLKSWSVVFLNKKYLDSLSEDFKNELIQKNIKFFDLEINDKYDNTYLLALACKYLWVWFDVLDDKIKEIFLKKSEVVYLANKKIIENIFNNVQVETSNITLEKIWNPKQYSYWNKQVTYWAIEWELEFYSAYPMTPASSILTEVVNSKKVNFLQAEDEIASINAALWASYTTSRAMVWTSGWGFALMTEALSFAIQAELPITVALSMRAWPSTWTPTYFEQWDLNYALNPTFWDFEHIVLYPSSVVECYEFWALALSLADKFQTVVILLLDKQLSELFNSFENNPKVYVDRGEIIKNPPLDYKRYENTLSWISPRVKVWTISWDFISTSYEHDEFWATSEDAENKIKMTQKRWRKLNDFYKNIPHKGYEVINPEAKKMFISMSANCYNLKAFVENNPEYGLIIIKILKPINPEILEVIKNLDEIIFVESNFSGQLESYITKEFGLKYQNNLKISNFRKYDWFPFYYEEIDEKFSK